jgi:uncharacterized YccA/Bax inhibitor family protein
MANPVLNPERFQREAGTGPGWASTAGPSTGATTQTGAAGGGGGGGGRFGAGDVAPAPATGKTMTLGGTLTATGVLFTIILVAGAFGWSQVTQTTEWVLNGRVVPEGTPDAVVQNTTQFPGWLFVALLVGVGLALVTSFVPKISPFTSPLYAVAYGAVLGAISAVYNQQWNGIVLQAVLATLGVFLGMFLLYATRIIKVTKKYVAVVIAATLGIFLMYMAGWIASLFGADIAFWNEPSALGIGISVVIVIVAALNLGIDFAFIEQTSKSGTAPKYMEWYGAFGVTVTIVWLYLEILRLLALLRQN